MKLYSIIRNQFLKVSQHSYYNMTFDYKLFSSFYHIHRLLWWSIKELSSERKLKPLPIQNAFIQPPVGCNDQSCLSQVDKSARKKVHVSRLSLHLCSINQSCAAKHAPLIWHRCRRLYHHFGALACTICSRALLPRISWQKWSKNLLVSGCQFFKFRRHGQLEEIIEQQPY